MKLACNIVPLAALGSALVILNDEMLAQLERPAHRIADKGRSWLDAVATKAIDTLESLEDVRFPGNDDDPVPVISDILASLPSSASEFDLHGHHPPHHPPTSDKTIYELLELSNHTKTFFSLVSEHESLVDILNSTKANHTLFVPTDRAFERIPPGHEKPSKEILEGFIKYHIADGHLLAKQLWGTRTVPTLLEERFLGDEKQRLRVRFTLGGLLVNMHSHVVVGNIVASNGVVHALDHILIPPPMIGKELSLLPSYFSTLLYAYDKTDFVSYIHNVYMRGSTVFAPTNHAFAKLGHRANAFLFETERGRGFLKALLKYQIVANVTLYSDAVYDKTEESHAEGGTSTHHELHTLLDGKALGVDIWRWGGWTSIKINGNVRVVLDDGIAKNGVIHVVDSVPLPPCRHRGQEEQGEDDEMEISVEELMERLEPWMVEEPARGEQVVFEDL